MVAIEIASESSEWMDPEEDILMELMFRKSNAMERKSAYSLQLKEGRKQ